MQGRAPRTPVAVLLLCWSLLATVATVRAEVASAVAGLLTITVKGHNDQASSAITFIGLGLTRPVVCQGHLESLAPNAISDAHATWVDDQFNGADGAHYLEIASGPAAGLMTDIVDTVAATKSLALADDLSSVLTGGETFKIRKHWTLAALFGTANQAGLGGGSNVTADEILVYDPLTGLYTTYFYKTIGLGGTGWRSTASSSADQAEAILKLTSGILIRRRQAADVSFKVFGSVKSGDTYLPVLPGLNLVGNVYPTDSLTLGTSGLFTGDPATGLAGGSNVSADKVLIYNGTTYDTYYYKTQGLGGIGWRSTASSSADASGTLIPAGTSILIQRATDRAGFYWVAGQPF